MTDKVQKIKDWISKEQDGLMDAQGNFEYPEHEGAYHILCNLDTYIDSLQEEPVSEEWIKELRTKLDSMSKEDFKKVFDKYAVDFNEEPISEELEQAAVEAFKKIVDDERNSFLEIFKAGAKLGKNQAKVEIQAQSIALAHGCPKEPVSEDLEEAAIRASMLKHDIPKEHLHE
jgi:hypothetical protein